MILTLPDLIRRGFASVHTPKEQLRALLDLGLDRTVLWPAMGSVVAISVLGVALASMVSPADMQDDVLAGVFRDSPLVLAALQLGMLSIMAAAIHTIGRNFGGSGRFEEALLAVIWLQWIMFCLQVLQILALVLAPPLVTPIALASMAIFVWCLVNFVAELHGFDSLGMVFAGVIMSAVGLLLAISVVLSLIGLVVTGAP